MICANIYLFYVAFESCVLCILVEKLASDAKASLLAEVRPELGGRSLLCRFADMTKKQTVGVVASRIVETGAKSGSIVGLLCSYVHTE